jgi:hypothetical protein
MSIDGTVGAALVANFTPTLLLRYMAKVYSSSFLVCAVGFGALAIWPVFFKKAKSSSCVLILTPAR